MTFDDIARADLVSWKRTDCFDRFVAGGCFVATPGESASAVIPSGFSLERAPAMRRDMELVRDILESVRDRKNLNHQIVNLSERDALEVARHVEMLIDAGYLDGVTKRAVAGGAPMCAVRDLTWEGHEFYGVLTSHKGWDAIKKKFSPAELAGLPLSVIKSVGAKAIEAWMLHQMGLGG